MISILCTKWGKKYNSDYVNILYSMIRKNYEDEFNFYCYTEYANGLDKEIKVIPIDDDLETWWNKITFFKWEELGQCLSFDLDLIIQNNIFPFIKENLHMIKCFWKDDKKIGKNYFVNPHQSTDMREIQNNSSIMSWKNRKDIWEKFIKNKEKILDTYITDDRWMHWQNIEYDTYQKGLCYSYKEGSDFLLDNKPKKYRPEYHVCIFHQEPKPHEVKDKWVKKFWN